MIVLKGAYYQRISPLETILVVFVSGARRSLMRLQRSVIDMKIFSYFRVYGNAIFSGLLHFIQYPVQDWEF